MLNKKYLKMRNMDNNIPEQYKAVTIAWPVEAVECAVYERAEKAIDCLSEAVLRFIASGINHDTDIAIELNVHADLIRCVKHDLTEAGFIANGHLAELGEKFLKNNENKQLFMNNECFGYMFICMFNGEVMPYFTKGNLPELRDIHEEIAVLNIFDNENTEGTYLSPTINISEMLFNDAYKLHCKISDISEHDNIEDEILYGREDFLYDSVEDEELEDEEAEITLYDVEWKKNAVRILQNKGRKLYIETILLINRRNSSDMCLLSPFSENTTNWYNKKFDFFVEIQNGITITENKCEFQFSEFIRELRQTAAAEIPFELLAAQAHYKQITDFYPALETAERLNERIKGALEEYQACVAAFDEGMLSGSPLINTGAKIIETLLNNFINKIKNRLIIINSIQTPEHVAEAFAKFGIIECWAKRSAPHIISRMTDKYKGWHKKGRIGNSIIDRYFFLVLEAYVAGKNSFGKLLKQDGDGLISALDFITEQRNEYGSHNDEDYFRTVEEPVVNEYIEKHFYATTLLINTLAEVERNG